MVMRSCHLSASARLAGPRTLPGADHLRHSARRSQSAFPRSVLSPLQALFLGGAIKEKSRGSALLGGEAAWGGRSPAKLPRPSSVPPPPRFQQSARFSQIPASARDAVKAHERQNTRVGPGGHGGAALRGGGSRGHQRGWVRTALGRGPDREPGTGAAAKRGFKLLPVPAAPGEGGAGGSWRGPAVAGGCVTVRDRGHGRELCPRWRPSAGQRKGTGEELFCLCLINKWERGMCRR